MINISNAGILRRYGKSGNSMEANVLAYAYDGEMPLFLYLAGTHEMLNGVLACFSLGQDISLARTHGGIEYFKPPKGEYEIVARNKLTRVTKTSAIIAHNSLRGAEYQGRVYVRGDDFIDRLARFVTVPFFEEWKPWIKGEALARKLIAKMPSEGITVWRVATALDAWITLIQNGLHYRFLKPITEVAQQ